MKSKFWLINCVLFVALIVSSCQKDSHHTLPVVHLRYYSNGLNLADYKKSKLKIEFEDDDVFNEYGPKVKYRGNSSYQYSKKSYSIKFEDKVSLFGHEASRYWKMNAEYIDKTFMRNKLSYELFRSFSEGNFAPHVEYVILYENQKYHGIYTITESVDEHRLKLKLKDPGAVLFKEPPLHFNPSEHDKRYANFVEYSKRSKRYIDFSPKARKKLIAECYYNQRYPRTQKRNKKEFIHDITEFLFNSDDEEFAEKVFTTYFDANNVMDWHLLLLVSNNGDGIKKNNYIYRKSMGEPFLYCPWDFDHSFGREGDGELIQEDICDIEQHILFKRLIEVNPDNYVQNLNAKYLTLKKKGVLTTKHMFGLIDDYAEKLRPEIEANETRWPLEKVKYFIGSSFEKEVTLMKDWIKERLPRIEKYLGDLQTMVEEAEQKKKEEMARQLIIPLPPDALRPYTSAVEPLDHYEIIDVPEL